MDIRISCIAWKEVTRQFAQVLPALEGALNLALEGKAFGNGIQRMAVVVVAVDAHGAGNEAFCQANHKVGFYDDESSQSRLRQLSLALPFDPNLVEQTGEDELRRQVCDALMQALEHTGLKLPGGFDFARFAVYLRTVLQMYREMECIDLPPLPLEIPVSAYPRRSDLTEAQTAMDVLVNYQRMELPLQRAFSRL